MKPFAKVNQGSKNGNDGKKGKEPEAFRLEPEFAFFASLVSWVQSLIREKSRHQITRSI